MSHIDVWSHSVCCWLGSFKRKIIWHVILGTETWKHNKQIKSFHPSYRFQEKKVTNLENWKKFSWKKSEGSLIKYVHWMNCYNKTLTRTQTRIHTHTHRHAETHIDTLTYKLTMRKEYPTHRLLQWGDRRGCCFLDCELPQQGRGPHTLRSGWCAAGCPGPQASWALPLWWTASRTCHCSWHSHTCPFYSRRKAWCWRDAYMTRPDRGKRKIHAWLPVTIALTHTHTGAQMSTHTNSIVD